jgi:hypothetical protein
MTSDRLILKYTVIKQWKMAFVLILGLTISMLLLTPNAYARNLSDSQRYNDGYNNGYSAALSDSSYNPQCDPQGQYTSGGGHTVTYCNGWANGYNDAWNRSNGNNNNQEGNQQQQTSNVNIHGNNNKVNINQGQSSNSGNTFSSYGNNPGGSNPNCKVICIS